jgi:uncharacterized delta-60 repeat protein
MDAGRVSGALAAVACLAVTAPATALGAGQPDPGFGTSGFTVIDVPTATDEYFTDVAVLSDDRILAAGGVGSSGAALGRFSSAGVPDSAYGTNGILIQADSGTGSMRSLNEIEFDASGRIIGAGLGNGSIADAVGLARYGPDGTPDPSFGGGDGIVVNECGGITCEALDVAITADGGIATAGKLGGLNTGVVKVDANGAPDLGFNGTGQKAITAPGDPSPEFEAIEALPDGSVLVGGRSDDGAILTKLDDAGNTVGGFGTAGIAVRDLGTAPVPSGEIFDIEVAPDGGIVVAGTSRNASSVDRMMVARFTPGGELDTSFAGDGSFEGTTDGPSIFQAALSIDPQGRIIAAGADGSAGWVARLSPAGVPDPSFGNAGQATFAPNPSGTFVSGVALQTDGATVLSGLTTPGAETNMLVGRLTGDPPPPVPGTCAGATATIVAAAEGGRVQGTSGNDVIAGGPGPDTISGLGGKDVICGVGGKDKLSGGAGNDKLLGGGGKDRLAGGGGKDRIFGGAGKDFISGGGGKDRCKGGPGRDSERSC